MGRILAGIFGHRFSYQLACLTLLSAVSGCGHKGPLIAPEPAETPAIEPAPKQLTLPSPQIQAQE